MPAPKKTIILGLIVVFIFCSLCPPINFSVAKQYGNDAAQNLIDNYTNSFANAMIPQVAAAQQTPTDSINPPSKTGKAVKNSQHPEQYEVQELTALSTITKFIRYISKPLQFNWPVSLIHDTDKDGLNNHIDPNPEIHERIAQNYASNLKISPDIVDLLAPLNTGPERLRPWGEDRYIHTGDFPPQLDDNEKDFIDVLALMDHNLQQQLVKLAAKGKIIDRDLTIMYYINSLKNPGLDESYSSELQEKVASAFQKDISAGAINTDAVEQLNFLSSLPLEEQVRLIELGNANNRDLDGDGNSNYFEKFVGNNLIYDCSVPNDWYVIIVDVSYPGPNSKRAWADDKNFFIKQGVPEQNIVLLSWKDATSSNLKYHLSDFAKKADENDIFYLTMNTHGGPSRLQLTDTMVYNSELNMWQAGYNVYYNEIDTWLAQINAGLKIVEINACYSGSALDEMTNVNLIMTQTDENTEAGGVIIGNIAFISGYSLEQEIEEYLASGCPTNPLSLIHSRDFILRYDPDRNGRISLSEAWEYVKYQNDKPQLSNPDLAKDFYFGDLRAYYPEDIERINEILLERGRRDLMLDPNQFN